MLPFLPFLFALIIAERGGRLVTTDVPLSTLLSIIGIGSLVWIVLCVVMNARIAKRRSHRMLVWWDISAQGAMLGWLAWLCLDLGWAGAVPGVMTALIPYLMFLLIHWATFAVGVRGVSRLPWTRWSMLIHQIRSSALPLVLGLGVIIDVSDHLSGMLIGKVPLPLELAGFAALAIFALVGAPLVMALLWGAKPLPEGPRRTMLEAACERMGYPGARLRRWPVPHGRSHNAVVLGIVPRTRVILLSDGIYQDLSDDELIAVLGHELGHARHRHLLIYILFLAVVMVSGTLVGDFLHSDRIPGVTSLLGRPWAETALTLLGAIVAWRIGFGWLSRGCERQADLAGAELAGSPLAMASALKTVARLSGEPENAPNWRHHSIAERAAFMTRVAEDPSQGLQHHRTMRFLLVFLLAIILSMLALNVWLSPVAKAARVDNPEVALAALVAKDDTLQDAITAADNGNPTELSSWYQRSDKQSRAEFAILVFRLPVTADNQPDDAAAYRLRYRMMAMSGIDSGNPELNLAIDNALAYALVAGTTSPTDNDLAFAKRLLPNLEQSLAAKPEHAIFDTVGCVYMRLENWNKAIEAFRSALTNLDTKADLSEVERQHHRELYQSRLDAATKSSEGTVTALPLSPSVTRAVESTP